MCFDNVSQHYTVEGVEPTCGAYSGVAYATDTFFNPATFAIRLQLTAVYMLAYNIKAHGISYNDLCTGAVLKFRQFIHGVN